ncbi:MAG: Hsp20/alpha crystallin family protein [Lachnospiraceae bacterium]|nr:Hsp20/alpha crystallin family protein [Lachnospiraceae bacterium]
MLLPMLWKRDNRELCNCNNDPFAEIDRWMNDFWGGSLFDGAEGGALFSGLKTDVIEKDGHYELEADLPGFDKEDIHVDVKDDVLTVTAEHKEDREEKKDGKYLRRERGYRSYKRSFRVDGLNQDDIRAQYKNGVLTLTLPKKEALPEKEEDVKRIAVTD